MIRNTLPLALVLLAAACARSEDASSPPADAAGTSRSVAPIRTSQGDDQELALGEWRETLQDDARALEFGPVGAPPLFSLGCDARRGILLQRHGAALVGDLPVMLVSVGSETRRLAITNVGGAIPMLRSTLPPSEPLTDRLAEATTPITIRIGDAAPLVLPPSPAIAAFLSDCAGEEGSAAEGANASGDANAAEPAAETNGAR
jgi:hypothetical protein